MQCALEVSRDRLVDVGLVCVLLDHPIGETFVQIRSQLLGEASIRGLEDERVREAPSTAGLVLRLQETLPLERGHRTLDLVRAHVRGEGAERRDTEPATFDGRALEDQTRHGIESIEPRGEKGLQGHGDLDVGVARPDPPAVREEPLIREHRRKLLQV